MLRDDLSNYKWIFALPDTAAENAATAIIDWCAAFSVPQELMSDGPTHFKNETLRIVAKGLKFPHNFTLPYTPQSSSAVERLGKKILRTCFFQLFPAGHLFPFFNYICSFFYYPTCPLQLHFYALFPKNFKNIFILGPLLNSSSYSPTSLFPLFLHSLIYLSPLHKIFL